MLNILSGVKNSENSNTVGRVGRHFENASQLGPNKLRGFIEKKHSRFGTARAVHLLKLGIVGRHFENASQLGLNKLHGFVEKRPFLLWGGTGRGFLEIGHSWEAF